MGLLTEILLLPVAPLRGTLWVAEQLRREAERQACDPRWVQARLAALNRDLDEGLIDEAAFEAEEERLLARLGSPVQHCGLPPHGGAR